MSFLRKNIYFILIVSCLMAVQLYFIFNKSIYNDKQFSTNHVIDYNIASILFPMAIEAYSDFSYINTAVSLWGVSDSNAKKSMLSKSYIYNIDNILKMNPKLKDTYYLTQGHFHGINNELNEFSNDVLLKGVNVLKGYQNIWELYFMLGMNTYLFSKTPDMAYNYFENAYHLTGNDKFLRLAEISKHKNGKLFVGLMTYKKLLDNETENKLKKSYEEKFILYQKAWSLQKNVTVFNKNKGYYPKSLQEIADFVGVDLDSYKKELNKVGLVLTYEDKNIDLVLTE